MVRLVIEDDLSDVMDKLGRAFGKVVITSLRHSFLAAAPPAKKAEAAQAFDNIYRAESELRTSKSGVFNNLSGKLTLLKRLPLKKQFDAMKKRQRAKEAVLELNREIGNLVVRHAAQEIKPTARRHLSFPSQRPTL